MKGLMVMLLLLGTTAHADEAFTRAIQNAIGTQFPGAKIELRSSPVWMEPESTLDRVEEVRWVNENGRGVASLAAIAGDVSMPFQVQFAALVPAYYANMRILPGQKIEKGALSLRDLDVAIGMGREMRGILLDKKADLSKIQARQTLMENQFVVSSAVEKIPDGKRGDGVQVELSSGGVRLLTQGQLEEPAYLNDSVRVLILKTKKEVIGKLASAGMVEVGL